MTCDNGQALGKDGCVWCLISCYFPWAAISIFRTTAREMYGIEGSEAEDWALGICCGPLVNCQTAAEIEEREMAGQARQ